MNITSSMTRKEYELIYSAFRSYRTFMTDAEEVLSEKILDDLFYPEFDKLASEEFGRAFWVDDNNDLKSCPLKLNNQPDLDYVDYVSEWTDWEGVNYDLLFNIYKTELLYKRNRADNVSYQNANQKEVMNTYDEDLYKEIVKDSKFSYGKFNQHNYPIHLQQL